MAVPKKRTSSSKSKMRRAHQALGKVNVIVDSLTGEYKLPHHISLNDGYYNGRQVFTVVENENSDELTVENTESEDSSEK